MGIIIFFYGGDWRYNLASFTAAAAYISYAIRWARAGVGLGANAIGLFGFLTIPGYNIIGNAFIIRPATPPIIIPWPGIPINNAAVGSFITIFCYTSIIFLCLANALKNSAQ